MKKQLLFCLLLSGLLLGGAIGAQALPFTDTVNFDGQLIWGGDGIIFNPPPFTYTHTLESIPAGSVLNNASLAITHQGNVSGWLNPEAWLVAGNAISLGNLSKSECWTTDVFDLSSLLASITSTTPMTLQVRLSDTTRGLDALCLKRSVVCGDFTPIPEPSSMLLLGSGILGLAGAGFRKRSNV